MLTHAAKRPLRLSLLSGVSLFGARVPPDAIVNAVFAAGTPAYTPVCGSTVFDVRPFEVGGQAGLQVQA